LPENAKIAKKSKLKSCNAMTLLNPISVNHLTSPALPRLAVGAKPWKTRRI
jgi:hypothetical protein